MKPYQHIPIRECSEPLVAIPLSEFAVETPHPYVKLGANYAGKSPYYLRAGVLTALQQAQAALQQHHPGWRVQIFDAYRPVAVQQFMVDYTLQETLRSRDLRLETLSAAEQAALWAEIYQFWALPSLDVATPPPHSTGAALDVTLVNADGQPVAMGSPIDELSPRSHPHHFAQASDPAAQQYHAQRELLGAIMSQAGFCRHPHEWWHFSLGDQMWAWQQRQQGHDRGAIARYGRCEA
ncbi:MAG: D-alanyl-D-alanine dipeptidase [Spirulinaceae cyanobacterium SM2_1_0]|nr:D-alanyl-D-alanine dipeptidase [Spirulinaceae cyanobacterium SM2_1_0]